MFWDILKIEPTKDRKAITKAYREELEHTNPEEKPEEFKALRAAYEDALAYAAKEEIPEADDAVSLWRKDLEALYADFARRIDVKEWERLFDADVCHALDQRMQVESTLFEFFLDSYFIPHEVWELIDREFSVLERLDEFYENYPKDFVDYVLVNGIHYPDTLPMKMFTPGKDAASAQKYLDLFLKIRRQSDENTKALIEEMLSLKEQHPYGSALALSYKIHFESPEAMEELNEFRKQYPADTYIGMLYLNELYTQERYEECEAISKELLEKNPDHNQVRWLHANSLANTGRYEEGVKEINELMRRAGGNQQQLFDLDQKRQEWNVNIISEKKAYITEHPEDQNAKVDLAWAYLENNEDEKVVALAKTISEEGLDPFDYHNLFSNLLFVNEDRKEAIKHLDAIIAYLDQLKEDGTEETARRLRRKGEMYGRKGYYLFLEGDEEKGLEAYRTGLSLTEDKGELLTELAQIYLGKREYETSMRYSKELVKERPDASHGYLMLAYAAYYLYEDREAFDAVNRSLDLNKTELDSYILKIRILIRNEAFEDAHKIIDFLKESDLSEHPSVLFTEGLLAEHESKNPEEAIRLYEASIEHMEGAETSYEFSAPLYYRLLCLKGEKLNGNQEEDRKIMMELADKGLLCDEKHYGLRDYKAWLLYKEKNYEEALKWYLALAEEENHSPNVESQIGYIYYQDLKKNAAKSLEYYQKALERHGDDIAYFYTGMCKMYLGDFKGAEEDFLTLQKLHPEDLDSYYRLSYIYSFTGDYEKATENINKTLDIVKNREGDQSYYYYRKVQLLRRTGRAFEAIELVRDMMQRFDYSYGNKLIFDILIQFGMKEEARRHLAEWGRSLKKDSDYYDALTMLDLLREKIFAAKLNRMNAAGILEPMRRYEIDRELAQYDGDLKKEERSLLMAMQAEEKRKDPDLSRYHLNLASLYFRKGEKDKQEEYAQKALEDLNARLEENRLNRLLYEARKVRALALIGKGREAYELLKELHAHPLCDNCPYGRCKDLDLFEVELEEVIGNPEKALRLAEKYSAMYPDEEEFVIMRHHLKKGK